MEEGSFRNVVMSSPRMRNKGKQAVLGGHDVGHEKGNTPSSLISLLSSESDVEGGDDGEKKN